MTESELGANGWSAVTGVTSDDQLIDLANALGTPVALSNGAFVRSLTPKSKADARAGTFGSIHGKGSYPLHTDTAFWPIPARYLVLRVTGDIRRPTTLCPFAAVLDELSTTALRDLDRSIWYSGTDHARFCCSLRFKSCKNNGMRYDPICMLAANPAAWRIQHVLQTLLPTVKVTEFEWKHDTALVISNWHVLHGRGSAPIEESLRELHRIYVS